MKTELIPGKSAPYICIPLVGRNEEEILKELKAVLPKEPDLLEWRVDFFEGVHNTDSVLAVVEQIAGVTDLPLLFTIRSEKEGGEKIPLSELEKVDLLVEACKSESVDIIDFEVSNDPDHVKKVRDVSREYGKKLILSYHNFETTPDCAEILKRLYLAEFYGADVAKAAVMPKDKEDVLRLLSVTREADEAMGIPVVTMSMGALGGLSRLMGWAYGSIMTFAVGVQSSAPGQIPMDELKEAIRRSKECLTSW